MESRVKAPVERVWAFHDSLSALRAITPPWVRLEVLYAEEPLRAGSRVMMRVKQHRLAPAYVWVALYTRHEPPECFQDTMVQGPFAHFVHTHRFLPDGDGTRLVDEIEYAAPFGPLGRVAERTIIPMQLRKMFKHRHAETRRLLEK